MEQVGDTWYETSYIEKDYGTEWYAYINGECRHIATVGMSGKIKWNIPFGYRRKYGQVIDCSKVYKQKLRELKGALSRAIKLRDRLSRDSRDWYIVQETINRYNKKIELMSEAL